jgi:hypothetical protein
LFSKAANGRHGQKRAADSGTKFIPKRIEIYMRKPVTGGAAAISGYAMRGREMQKSGTGQQVENSPKKSCIFKNVAHCRPFFTGFIGFIYEIRIWNRESIRSQFEREALIFLLPMKVPDASARCECKMRVQDAAFPGKFHRQVL